MFIIDLLMGVAIGMASVIIMITLFALWRLKSSAPATQTVTETKKNSEKALLLPYYAAENAKEAAGQTGMLYFGSAAAEREYSAALAKLKPGYSANFFVTRKEIAEDTRNIGDPDITVVERPKQPQLPASLKYRGKTYAMLHGTDDGLLMIVKIPDEYAELLGRTHPNICRANFPHGANWYYIPIDGAFWNKDSVYSVLTSARRFVAAKNGFAAAKPLRTAS